LVRGQLSNVDLKVAPGGMYCNIQKGGFKVKRIFNKWIYPWLPFIFFVFLVAGASNFGRIVLDETPEITGSNGETISNATDGTWTFSSDITTGNGVSNFANSTGIAFFEPGLTEDTLVHSDIYYNSQTDHSLIFLQYCDTVGKGYGDSLILSYRFLSADTIIIQTLKAPGSGTDTAWYAYWIVE